MCRRPELHLAGQHAFQPLTHILPVDDVPESIGVVGASALVFEVNKCVPTDRL